MARQRRQRKDGRACGSPPSDQAVGTKRRRSINGVCEKCTNRLGGHCFSRICPRTRSRGEVKTKLRREFEEDAQRKLEQSSKQLETEFMKKMECAGLGGAGVR